MPFYHATVRPGLLSSSAREGFANDVVDVHCGVTGAPLLGSGACIPAPTSGNERWQGGLDPRGPFLHDASVTERPLRIRPLAERKNLVDKGQFARVLPPIDGFLSWFEALPEIYGSRSLKQIVARIVDAVHQSMEYR